MERAAFYSIADSRHFIGVVALLNSLRLAGHDEQLFIADCGLEPAQRELLSPHASVMAAEARVPYELKVVLPSRYPAHAMALLDADIIVTRNLSELLDLAGQGRVAGFTDAVAHRHHPDWGDILGLGTARRQPYVNSGALFLPAGSELLSLIPSLQSRVDIGRTRIGSGTPSEPFYYVDQDLWNALLATTIGPDDLKILEHRLAPHPPFPGLTLIGDSALRCTYPDGVEPFLLHHVTRKPWLAHTRSNLYSRLLSRLVLGDDVALRLPPELIPRRLRVGRLASLERRRSDLLALGQAQRGKLGIRKRMREFRRQTVGGDKKPPSRGTMSP